MHTLPSGSLQLLRSLSGREVGLSPPFTLSGTKTHTLTYGIAMGFYSLSFPLRSLSLGW